MLSAYGTLDSAFVSFSYPSDLLASGKTKQLGEYLCGMLQWLFLNWSGKVFVGIVGRLGVVVIGMGNEYSIDIGTYIGIYIDIQST